jgi:hypothetical protein
MSGDRSTFEAVKTAPNARSRLTNGTALLSHVDGRSPWAPVLRDTRDAPVHHLGGDPSETQTLAVRRSSALEAELVHLESKFGLAQQNGNEPSAADLTMYCALANAQRRFAEALGWQRTARDVTPSLSEYARTIDQDVSEGQEAEA